MSRTIQHQACLWQRGALAGLMVLLVFALGLVAANEQLHLRLHQDSTGHHTSCPVCAVSQGQLHAPMVSGPVTIAAPALVWTVPEWQSASPQTIDFSVAYSRGPPVSVSSV